MRLKCQNTTVELLNDYEKLLVYLFSDNYEEILIFKNEAERSNSRIAPPVTKLDTIKAIWEILIPHRELVISSGSIQTRVRTAQTETDKAQTEIVDTQTGTDETQTEANNTNIVYSASEMSDGERVLIYLIGQSLCAPQNGIIVIDEPELHLHHSLHQKLWDLIEKEREDCLFVYLTHDLDFATSRTGAKKVCLNNFDGVNFDWYEVPKEVDIPEDIYLEILGSRNPVLFVEGEAGSHDIELYHHIYPNFTIKPLGSCEKVIEAVKAFNRLSGFHYIQAYGIIDRDYKSDNHIASYEGHGVFVPDFAEVENIFLIESVLSAVAKQLCIPPTEDVVGQIKGWVIGEFERLKETYALEYTSYHVNTTLNGFDGSADTITTLKKNFMQMVGTLDINNIYQQTLNHAQDVITRKDYEMTLSIFNHKGLVNQVGKFFGIKPSSYTQKVKDIIQYGQAEIVKAMQQHMPSIQ